MNIDLHRQKIETRLAAQREDLRRLEKAYDLEDRCHDCYDNGDPAKKGELLRIQGDINITKGEIDFLTDLLNDCTPVKSF